MFRRGGLLQSIMQIYGIGMVRAKNLLNLLGYSENYKINEINNYQFSEFVAIFKGKYILDERLEEIVSNRIEFFYVKNFIKGTRLLLGLPLKGRTHSNASNAFVCKPFLFRFSEEANSKRQRLILSKKKQKSQKVKKK